jgi:uncharacterized protein YggU (UPF0235/DUF167 family)
VSAEPAPPFRINPEGLELTVRATPRGGRDALDGLGVDASGRRYWQVRVRVAPEEGAANRAVLGLVADMLGVPLRDIRIAGGETSRIKRLQISGNGVELASRAVLATASLTKAG